MGSQLSPQELASRILVIRGQRVMLDSDLASLYGVETRALNQAVRRNEERFPGDFMFELTREEIRNISQIVICPKRRIKLKHSPQVLAFTEYGVAMLSSVLRSAQAVQVNVQIMRTFGKLREIIATNDNLARRLEALERKYDARFKAVFDAIRELMAPETPPRKQIGFNP